MSNLIKIEQAAGEFERFAPEAFANVIGQTTTMNFGGHRVESVIIDAKVNEDGTAVTLTLDVPDDVLNQLRSAIGHDNPSAWSFRPGNE